jgi:UPF0716 protein FxsA
MAGLLLLLFVIVPIIELAVMIQVGSWIGAGPTIALLLLFTIGGVWLVKYEGLGVWTRFRRQVEQGAAPANELVDGFLILVAGALLIIPGFVTDVVGLLLLVPPVRSLARNLLIKRSRSRLRMASVGYGGQGVRFPTARVYDVESVGDVTPPEWRDRGSNPRGELEP